MGSAGGAVLSRQRKMKPMNWQGEHDALMKEIAGDRCLAPNCVRRATRRSYDLADLIWCDEHAGPSDLPFVFWAARESGGQSAAALFALTRIADEGLAGARSRAAARHGTAEDGSSRELEGVRGSSPQAAAEEPPA